MSLLLRLSGLSSCPLQNESTKQWLFQVQQLWDSVEKKHNHMMLKIVRTSQTLDFYGNPQLSLQAKRRFHEKLQVFFSASA